MSEIALENYITPLLIAPARQDVEFRFLSGDWSTAPRPWRFILEFTPENPPIIGDALIFTYAGEDITLNFVNTEVEDTDVKHFAPPETWVAYCVRFLNKIKNLDVLMNKLRVTAHLIQDDKFRIYFEDKVVRTTDFNVDGDDWVKMDSSGNLLKNGDFSAGGNHWEFIESTVTANTGSLTNKNTYNLEFYQIPIHLSKGAYQLSVDYQKSGTVADWALIGSLYKNNILVDQDFNQSNVNGTYNFAATLTVLESGVHELGIQFQSYPTRPANSLTVTNVSLIAIDSSLRLGYSFKIGYSIEDNETNPLDVELSVWDNEKMMMLVEMAVPFIKEPAYSHIFNIKGYLLDILEYFYERNLANNLPDLSAVNGKEFPDVCRRYGVLSSIGNSALYFEGFALLGGYSSVSRAGYLLQDTLEQFAEPLDINDDFMFLTNQKLEKEVTLTQPEFLYCLIREDYTEEWGNYFLSLVIHLYYTDGTDEPAGRNVVISNYQPAVYGSPSGYSVIEDLLDEEKTLLKWTAQFRLVNQALTETLFVSPVMTYYPVAEGFHDRYFLFRNGLGGWDTFRTVGKLSKKIDLDKKLFDIHATNSAMIDVRDYSPALKDKYTVVIDSLTADEADYYRDFFLSRYKYWLVDGKLVRIALLSGDIGIYDERELLHVVQFEFVTDRVLMSVGIESFSEIDDFEIEEPWEGDEIEDDDEGGGGGGGGPLV